MKANQKNKKRMMYLLNVNWDWIKQRPQYLAEALTDYFNVDVFEKKAYRRARLVHNSVSGVHLFQLFHLPLERFHTIHKWNNFLYKWQLGAKIKNYDYIWLASPEYYVLLKDLISPRQHIIYDCMDDVIEFPQYQKDREARNRYLSVEGELVRQSTSIFVSADHLKHVLMKRNPGMDERRILVVNNAVSDELLIRYDSLPFASTAPNRDKKIITYIGTISEWINWPLILKSADTFRDIEYRFYGPLDSAIPNHPQIHYMGVLTQDKIAETMQQADLLIMPFIVNPLIESVNPVKLYEYILSGKPSLACSYTESDKFADYVYLYHDEKEYMQYIDMLREGRLTLQQSDGRLFVKQNTWKIRAKQIIEFMAQQK